MKNTSGVIAYNLKSLAVKYGCIPVDKTNLKFSDVEVIKLLDSYMSELGAKIETARKEYKKQREIIRSLEAPQLWRFGTPTAVPPEYKAEYARRFLHPEESDNPLIAIKKKGRDV